MALVNDIKCARCDRKYSGVRSRCPYCGARRIGRGKYTEDADNAKGKMLISILILSVFTVAAGVMLFTTPTDSSALPTDDPSISNPEGDVDAFPGFPIDDPPTPTPPVVDTPAPLQVETAQIWIPGSHRVKDFTLSPRWGLEIQLTALLDPPGIDVPISWESTNYDVIVLTDVVGGVKVTAVGNGSATIILKAGEIEDRCVVYVNNMP